MGNQTAASQAVREGGIVVEKHRPVGIQRGTHVFHAAVLESRDDDQIIFGERIGNAGVGLEPIERMKYLGEDVVTLCPLLRIGLPMVERDAAAVMGFGDPLETPSDKRKQVGGDGFRLFEGDLFASRRQCVGLD